MFMTPNSRIFSLVALSCFSLSQAAPNNTVSAGSPSAVPECAANCMSIKITEAANWFNTSDVQTYCQHREFLLAYNNCLKDHCQGDDLIAGRQAGEKTCAGVTPDAGGAPGNPNNPKNATAHPPLSGPAGTPDNSTLLGNSSNTLHSATNNSTSSLNGALSPTSNLTSNNAANTTSRFSGATGSAAANASSQAGTASGISSSSAIMFTAFSSCLLSLVI